MADENRGGRRVLKSFVRFDRSGKLKPRESEVRRNKTFFSYLHHDRLCGCRHIHYYRSAATWGDPHPVPKEDLPYVIPLFILVYIAIIGLLYLRDRFRNKP